MGGNAVPVEFFDRYPQKNDKKKNQAGKETAVDPSFDFRIFAYSRHYSSPNVSGQAEARERRLPETRGWWTLASPVSDKASVFRDSWIQAELLHGRPECWTDSY